MSEEKELLESIRKVFDSKMYNIPAYQRGYKWTSKNIQELLKDIYNFKDDLTKDNFYCLQNITLVEENGVYNVVDGQQRLTTLVILLSYLKYKGCDIPDLTGKLKYSVREETHNFIIENIISGKFWKEDVFPERKDQYYICEVAKVIRESLKEKNDLGEFAIILLDRVKLIINIVIGKEEKIFSSLNGGKVQLDGADLLRAVLMTRAAKEKFGDDGTMEEINEFRVRMGMELDSINFWFEKRKEYFIQFISDATKGGASEKFNIKSNPINILYLLYFEYNKEKYDLLDFRFFEYGKNLNDKSSDDRWEMYEELNELYKAMQVWYEDKELYHYLGFLMFQFKKSTQFKGIYIEWRKLNSRELFTKYIKKRIAKELIKETEDLNLGDMNVDDAEAQRETALDRLVNEISEISSVWYGNQKLNKILVLMDCFHFIESKIGRLKETHFLLKIEDIEHIRSQTPNPEEGSRERSREEWTRFVKDLEDFPKEIKEEIIRIIQPEEKSELSDGQIANIEKMLGSIGLNSIGNLAILNAGINRGYKNAVFSCKRLRIIREYTIGEYIRPHTLNVFMKGYGKESSGCDLKQWCFSDIKENAIYIANKVKGIVGEWLNHKITK